jgi:hypothetical protein
MEHLPSINLRWQFAPSTVALVGYQFGVMDFTANQRTGIFFTDNRGVVTELTSSQRDSRSHYAYVGADHSFNPQLDASLRVGAQFTEYYNLPGGGDDQISPYADANVTYKMTPDSWVQLGARHSRIATDAAALDQENTTFYGSLNYRIVPPVVASVLGQYQYNTFEQGQPTGLGSTITFRDKVENFWLLGLNLTYEINKFLAAEIGYNYDRLDSDLSFRTYTRNRVYFGFRAQY